MDQRPAIIKVLRDDHPTEREVARVEIAWNIGSAIKSGGVISHLELVPYKTGLALITEDIGGASLREQVTAGGIPLREWLDIAIDLTRALLDVHQHRVIHKDIKPGNAIYNPATGALKLIDFGLSHRLRREEPDMVPPQHLEGTLPYISPEQTGRMNRSLDHRSDLYSLGITLYELLCGTRPFNADDAIGIIHAHLTTLPEPITARRPDVPQAVSDILSRLLAKTPEDRYQSAYGLVRDLERCRDALMLQGDIEPFELARDDLSTILRIPERLYGREGQLATLLTAFERATEGGRALLLVSGWSGVGKTALIREIHKPITSSRGRFCAGKFDQYHRDIPYQAIAGALRGLLNQALTEPEEILADIRERLIDALGHHGIALAELLPELKRITGPLPDAADVGPTEARHRFNETFKRFIGVFARPRSPLVLFLDDLQWADLPSLEMLQVLLTADNLSNLLIIGAYRDNEVGDAHPLKATLSVLSEAGVDSASVHLEPLSLLATSSLIGDALHAAPEDALALAKVVHEKTDGNPFFIGEMLRALARDGHVALDSERGKWRWDIQAVRAAPITDNVLDLLASRIEQLPEETRAALPVAACIGNTFDLATLLAVSEGGDTSELRASDARAALEPALNEGLLAPLGNTWRRASADPTTVRYRFVHDRVHQAALAELPTAARASISLVIARRLLASDTANERTIDIASHFDLAGALLSTPEDKRAALCAHLAAGQRAKAALALEPARHYLRLAYDLLPADPWSTEHDLTMALHVALVDAEMRTGEAERAEALGEAALAHASDPLQVMPIYSHRIQDRISRLAYTDALVLAREGLGKLGVFLPANPGKLDLVRWLVRTKLALRGKTPEGLVEAKEAEPRIQAAQDLLMTASAAAYYCGPEWLMITSLEGLRLSLKHGVTPQTPYSCTMYALICGAVQGDYEMAGRFGKASYALLERFNSEHIRAKLVAIEGGFVRNWLYPLRDNVKYFFDGWQIGVDQGDFTYASYTMVQAGQTAYASGMDLRSVLDRFNTVRPWLVRCGQEQSMMTIGAWVELMVKLHDPQTRDHELKGEWVDAGEELRLADERGESTAIVFIALAQGVLAYLLGDTAHAYERTALAREHSEGVAGMLLIPLLDLYQGLSALAMVRAGDSKAKAVAKRCRKSLNKWTRIAGPEHKHRSELLEAEWLRSFGDPLDALKQYKAAAALSKEQGFVQHEAIAWANMGDMLLTDMGLDIPGYAALYRAAHLFRRWGAHALANRTLERLPQDQRSSSMSLELSLTSSIDGSGSMSHSREADVMDLHSVLAAARSISEEIELPRLLDRVMDALLRGAGAERGLLLLSRDGELSIQAVGVSTQNLKAPVNQMAYPRSLIAWVERSQEPMVLYDAGQDEIFSQDADVQTRGLRSTLASPLMHKGELIGVVYLENNLAPGIFTLERLEAVRLLASQAAISIQNSWLFREQERLVKSFHRFVPEPFLEHLGLASVADAEPGDAVSRQITVLFSDIRGFTALAEQRSAREIFDLLNTYFERMGPAIERNGGFIDKFIGDAIMALFPGTPDQAVAAAIAMQRRLARLNEELGDEELVIGVGLHTGPLTLGTIGTAQRMETTVIGDTVNLAARLESLTKRFGARVLLSQEVADGAANNRNLTLRMVGRVQAVGKSAPTTLYEVLEAEPDAIMEIRLETMEVYQRACTDFYAGRLPEAAAGFQVCLNQDPSDKASLNYLKRCAELKESGLPETWNGVEVMLQK